ncbi:MAG: acyl-CoA dehydrogenase [Rhodocyclaceae bacterium]|nr:acyl-CoA dehydrogenase [Rhodocyclaceae bacterium]MBX3668817.1 acyl-CoA dehydrogenase [Rhodocyclaceae bacterium]
MTTYIAPVRDMLFAMKELAGLAEVNALPGYEESSEDLVEAILDEAGKFASDVLAPINAQGDRQGARWADTVVTAADGFKDAYTQFSDNGWHAMPAGTDLGGQGLPTLVSIPVQEMWKSANMAFALCPMLTMGAVEAVAHHGSDELKARYLPNMVAGTWTGTMNLTEPQAGSDLAAVRTKAVPNGDHYLISGTKIFITWGEHDMAENIIHLVLARLPDAPPGVKGISLFVVPKFMVNADGSLGARNDLLCASIEHKMGIHGSPTAVMAFGEKEGAIGYLVGQANRGLEYMFTMMNHARLNVGLEGVAISERAYQQALNYARERVQGKPIGGTPGQPILQHPDVRRMLMNMKSRVEAMRATAYYTAAQIDVAHSHPDDATRLEAQRFVELFTPVVKGWCTEASLEITSTGIQVHGGVGFIEETGACQHMRDARITTIYEGTTGIQANDLIGRKLSRDKGETANALASRIRATADQLTGSGDAALARLGERLNAGVQVFTDTVSWVLAQTNPAVPAAGAVPFLWLTGTVVGAWQMARAAQVASARLAAGDGDASFWKAKQATASFFIEHELPRTLAWQAAIQNGAASVLALEDAQF